MGEEVGTLISYIQYNCLLRALFPQGTQHGTYTSILTCAPMYIYLFALNSSFVAPSTVVALRSCSPPSTMSKLQIRKRRRAFGDSRGRSRFASARPRRSVPTWVRTRGVARCRCRSAPNHRRPISSAQRLPGFFAVVSLFLPTHHIISI